MFLVKFIFISFKIKQKQTYELYKMKILKVLPALLIILFTMVFIAFFVVGPIIREKVDSIECSCFDFYENKIDGVTCECYIYDYKWLSFLLGNEEKQIEAIESRGCRAC